LASRHAGPAKSRSTKTTAEAKGLRLIQAFEKGASKQDIPVDQVLVESGGDIPVLVLPKGEFWVRVIDAEGNVLGPVKLIR